MGIAMILAPATGSVLVFAIAVALTGVAQVGYTPNLHAYLSTRLPYEKRAMGMGVTEYSWALAGILGLFVSGYLIEVYSWKAPFYVIGSVLLLMSLVFGLLPKVERSSRFVRRTVGDAERPRVNPIAAVRDFFRLGEHARSAWAAIAVTGLNMFAMLHLLIIHGGWLQSEYGLGPSSLGTVALVFGVADLVASVTVSLFVDRIGKRRSVLIGVVGMVLGYTVLPFLNRSLVLAVLSIAIPRMSFEFAVVSNFPLLSEQAPQARGKVLSLSATAGLLGTTLAGLTGPAAYLRFGVWGLGPVSCAVALVSLTLLVAFVRERPHHSGQ
jgi:predicted MFS family arabinose efflux permease